MNLKTAAQYLNMNVMYVRKLVQSGKIPSQMVQVKGDVERYEITKEACDAYKAQHISTSRREDGLNKFNLYISMSDQDKVREILTAAGINFDLVKANVKKTNNEDEVVELEDAFTK